MTTTLGLTVLATCAVVMPLETVVPSAALSESAEELSRPLHLLDDDFVAAAEACAHKAAHKAHGCGQHQSDDALYSLACILLRLLRRGRSCVLRAWRGAALRRRKRWVLSLKVEAVFAVFMPLEPTLG